jgi:hypothetical protein
VIGLLSAILACKPATTPAPAAPAATATPVASVPSAEERSIPIPEAAITATDGGYLVPMPPGALADYYAAALPPAGWTIDRSLSALPSGKPDDTRVFNLAICRQPDVWRALVFAASENPSVSHLLVQPSTETKPCSGRT